jgi:hypothetical protein
VLRCAVLLLLLSVHFPPAVPSLVSVPPLVACDPVGRCAAALLHGRLLAVLPAIQADVMELLLQQVRV